MHLFNTLSVITVCNQIVAITHFTTLSKQAIKAPILFVHAENDWDIPYTHSETLFDAILEPLLPSSPTTPTTSWSQEDWDTFSSVQSERTRVRTNIVTHTEIRHFGTMDEFTRKDEGKVVLLKTVDGGHNRIGTFEGVQDVIRATFDLR
jgi:abhydrolase domain-containing protein 12